LRRTLCFRLAPLSEFFFACHLFIRQKSSWSYTLFPCPRHSSFKKPASFIRWGTFLQPALFRLWLRPLEFSFGSFPLSHGRRKSSYHPLFVWSFLVFRMYMLSRYFWTYYVAWDIQLAQRSLFSRETVECCSPLLRVLRWSLGNSGCRLGSRSFAVPMCLVTLSGCIT